MRRHWRLLLILVAICIESSAQMKGTITEVTIDGPVTNRPIVFSLYLPESYGLDSTKHYPVIYHLHGLNNAHNRNQVQMVPNAFEEAKSKNLIGDVIIVFPDGYTNGMWADKYDGTKPAETNVIREIIPYIDQNFRTIPDKQHRFVEGFSMGGYGALYLITKYPEIFGRASCYDGAFHNWETLVSIKGAIATEIFNNNEAYFNEYTFWPYLVENKEIFKKDTLIYIAEGALTLFHQNLKKACKELDIPLQYETTGCRHNLKCLLESQGDNTARFFNQALNK